MIDEFDECCFAACLVAVLFDVVSAGGCVVRGDLVESEVDVPACDIACDDIGVDEDEFAVSCTELSRLLLIERVECRAAEVEAWMAGGGDVRCAGGVERAVVLFLEPPPGADVVFGVELTDVEAVVEVDLPAFGASFVDGTFFIELDDAVVELFPALVFPWSFAAGDVLDDGDGVFEAEGELEEEFVIADEDLPVWACDEEAEDESEVEFPDGGFDGEKKNFPAKEESH